MGRKQTELLGITVVNRINDGLLEGFSRLDICGLGLYTSFNSIQVVGDILNNIPNLALITSNGFAGTLFLNSLLNQGASVDKIFVVDAVRGGGHAKIKRSARLLFKKSSLFFYYKIFYEGIFSDLMLYDKSNILPIQKLARINNIPIDTVSDVSNKSFIKTMHQEFRNHLVISAYGSQIFPPQFIAGLNNIWNAHGSYLPFYKGAAPYFWMLKTSEYPRGITIHEVAEELDGGPTLKQVHVIPDKNESLYLYHARCVIEAACTLHSLIVDFEHHGNIEPTDESLLRQHTKKRYGLPSHSDMNDFFRKGYHFYHKGDLSKIRSLISNEQLASSTF